MGVPVGQRRAEQLRQGGSPAEEGPAPADVTPADASAGSVSLHGDERTGLLRLKFGEGVGIVPPAALAPDSAAPSAEGQREIVPTQAPPAAQQPGAASGDGTSAGPSVASMSRAQLLALIRSRQSATRARDARRNGGGPVPAANPALDTLVLEGGEEGRHADPAPPAAESAGERRRSRSARRHRKREKRERKERKKRKKRGRKRRRSSRGSSSDSGGE